MKKELIVAGSIGAGILLILSMVTTVVSAQTVKTSEIKTNIVQQIKEKIKNNDWKPGDIQNIQHLKDVIKDSGWFPGFYLFVFIWNIILLLSAFLGVFVF